jgi:hypothetical protein
MTEQTDVFDVVPSWLQYPVTRIERAFARFHRQNPDVLAELERLALDLWRLRHPPRIGIAMLYEACRYNQMLKTEGGDWKLNNDFRSLYARLLRCRHPELEDVIELRERREFLVHPGLASTGT